MVASTGKHSTYQVFDSVMTPASDEDVTSRIPEVSRQCGNLAEAASKELPLNVEEALIREVNNETNHEAVLDQEMTEAFAFSFPDPASILQIHGSARSYQGHVQGAGSLPSSSVLGQTITTAAQFGPQVEHLTSRAASSEIVHEVGVQLPNISYGGSTVSALTNTSLPNNSVGQNPHMFIDPFEYELEKLRKEKENFRKNLEETTADLMAELEKKMAEVRSEYDRKFQEVDAAYNAKAMEEEANRKLVTMSSLLANAMMSKCAERSAAADSRAARTFHHPTQQQQAVQRNTHMNSTAPLLPSVTAAEAPIPNPSGPLSQFPRNNTNQSATISQQAAAVRTHMSSSAPPLPSVTAVEAPITNPPGPLSHFARTNTNQSTTISHQAAAVRTLMTSTALPRPSVTASEAPIPSPPVPLSHFARTNTNQSTPMSQQAAAVRSNTHMSSTALPRPSVTASGAPIPSPPVPLSHFARTKTNQSTPMSQQAAAVRTNTHMSSTALPRPSVTAADAHALQSPLGNTPHPRPPPLISNLTPSSSTPRLHGIKRSPAPHLQSFRSSRAPMSAAASTAYESKLLQEQQHQQKKSNGGLVCLSDDDE